LKHATHQALSPNSATNSLEQVVIVLSHTSHPGNIGSTARAMKTMGLVDLRLVNPKIFPSETADALASGATDVLLAAQVFDSVEAALHDCAYVVGTSARGRDSVAEVLPARAAAVKALQHASSGQKVALLFGTEMSGLTNQEVALCHTLAYITANPVYSSLNLSQAVQVMAYECRCAAELDTGYAAPLQPLASQEQVQHLFTHATQTFIGLKFLNPAVPKRLLPRLRRLFARAKLEQEEVDIFRGLLRSIDELIAKNK
jgi:tRNA/rRNA methyltransferase